ncbi:DUF421 domain-containing protein [Salipaludibacillus neizhouensis]|uniref:DUF421 domain-containing protein n=1 Tax=Salipaludibacillus neizhouensis TaxID=885475 RepID=A0A3A9KXK3_9BACI|nr:DUF421 domain-containing protein [Salipaludibacillus neizhouensis]RKL69166.1 DUF421 domain-containing protein [Salipaludibacillus neizhouensis]
MPDFWLGDEGLPISGFIIRAGIIYIYMFLLVKVLGQRSMTTMNPIDFLFGVIIGDVLGEPLADGEAPLPGPMSAAAFIVGIHLFLSYIALKLPRFRRIIEDEPIVLMEKSKILHKNMSKAKVTVDQLMMDLRLSSAIDLTEIDYAVLESNGQISVIKKTKHEALTPWDSGNEPVDKGYPSVIVLDGRYVDGNIKKKVSRSWVDEQLSLRGYGSVKDVFLMTVDEQKNIYLSEK